MSGTSNESDDGMLYKYHSESPPIDDGNGGSSGGGAILKKGPWTSNEDAILVEYVKKHGEGNWNAVQKHSGLSRCGKSCRLRWANHLRPNLKKGAFTQDEEALILELHAKMGNKWARMASYLPGRTDNEIKNYWNTRVKRRQRAGLPLYPPDLCLQVLQETQQGQHAGAMSCGDLGQHESLDANAFEIPDVMFDGLSRNSDVYSYVSEFPATDAVLMKSGPPQFYDFAPQPMIHHRQKRIRESSDMCPDPAGSVHKSFPPQIDQFPNNTCNKMPGCFGDLFPQEFDPGQSLLSFDATQGVHSLLNGNPSASVPFNGAVKLELPSLQYPDADLSTWGASSPLPSLESVDTYIQSPLRVDVPQPCPEDRQNSGLLGDLIQEAMHLSRVKKNLSEKSFNSSSCTPGDGIVNVLTNEYTEPTSPLAQSATSFLIECISPGGSSLDDTSPPETIAGNHVKPELVEMGFSVDKENESKKPTEFIRPDALLGSDWFECPSFINDRDTMTDAIATLIGSDLVSDCNVEAGSGSSSSSQEWGYGRYVWNCMPSTVCQMSDPR